MNICKAVKNDAKNPVFRIGGNAARAHVESGELFDVEFEDAFSGQLDTAGGKPRGLAPLPNVNPLSGLIAVLGAQLGHVLAVYFADVAASRD